MKPNSHIHPHWIDGQKVRGRDSLASRDSSLGKTLKWMGCEFCIINAGPVFVIILHSALAREPHTDNLDRRSKGFQHLSLFLNSRVTSIDPSEGRWDAPSLRNTSSVLHPRLREKEGAHTPNFLLGQEKVVGLCTAWISGPYSRSRSSISDR